MPIYRLGRPPVFPDPREAEPDGLLAVGGDLSPRRLLMAYASGIFPWYEEGGPILWWSPPERAVFLPGDEHLSRRTLRTLRRAAYTTRLDTAFDAVVEACASVPRGGTWITPGMRQAYGRLHVLGWAHSVETWAGDHLVGGLYGLSIGAAFFGESMFSLENGASRAAFARLCETCWGRGLAFIDGQLPNENLASLGARVVDRDAYLALLGEALAVQPVPGPWSEPFGAA